VTDYRPPRLLESGDRLDKFVCRSSEQTEWLGRHARQPAAAGDTKVFVVTHVGPADVVRYYAWRMAQLDVESAPPRGQLARREFLRCAGEGAVVEAVGGWPKPARSPPATRSPKLH
jgi:hypothetical protein